MLSHLNNISSNFLLNWLSADQQNEMMNKIGFDSQSTFVNIYSYISSLFIFAIFHIIVTICYYKFKWNSTHKIYSFVIKIIKWIAFKLFCILTFCYYIRSFIDIFQYLTLSSINELKAFRANSSPEIISFVFTIILLMLWVAFVVVSIIFIFRDRPSNSCDKYEEFSVDLKPNRKAKLYTTIWLVRRIAFAIIVVSLSSVSSFTVLLLMTIIQWLLYLVFIIIVRPFSEPKDNTIEITNEIVFTLLVWWQFYFNSEQRWNNAPTSIYIWTICLNNFIVFLIITGIFIDINLAIVACIFSLIKTWRQKYSRIKSIQSYLSKIVNI